MERGITARELDVLWAAAEYGSNEKAADHLGLSLQTVKNHVSAILKKTGSRSALQAYHRIISGRRFVVSTTTTTHYEEIPE